MRRKVASTIGRVVLIALTVVLTGIIIWAIYWWPVIDRLTHLCEHYPAMFADCQE